MEQENNISLKLLSPASTTSSEHPAKNEAPDENLRQGCPLPATVDRRFTNVPLEEIDPFYEGTFVTVNGKWKISRWCRSNALFCLSPFNPVRKAAILIDTHSLFQWFIFITVIVNCYFLMVPKTETHAQLEFFFIAVYTLEFMVKLTARGFLFDQFTYLRNGWNILDLIILILAYVGEILQIKNLGGLRTLKLVSNTTSLRWTFENVLKICGSLLDIFLLTLVSLCTCALIGVHLYMGLLTQKCILEFKPGNRDIDWLTWNLDITHWYPYPPPDYGTYPVCGNSSSSGICPEGYTCVQGYGPNPDYGYTNFDSFGWAMLSVIRMFKLDFWEALYQQIVRAAGSWHKLYFTSLMLILSFYMLGLIYAVVAVTFSRLRKEGKLAKIGRKQETPRESGVSKFPVIDHVKRILDKIFLCECFPPCTKMRELLQPLANHPITALFMTVVLALNTLVMSVEHYEYYILHHGFFYWWMATAELTFTLIYAGEFVLNVVTLSPKRYFQRGWHRLEFAILCSALIELVTVDMGLFNPMIFLFFRGLRVFRLAQHWPSFNRLLAHLRQATSGEFLSFLVLIHLVMFTFAVIGMEQFGQTYLEQMHLFPNREMPRWNFIDFSHAFLLVFRAVCGEWIETMWDCALVSGIECVPFFLSLIFVANILTLVFFIQLYQHAVLEINSENSECSETPNKIGEAIKIVKNCFRLGGNISVPRSEIRETDGMADDEVALHHNDNDHEHDGNGTNAKFQLPSHNTLPPAGVWSNFRSKCRTVTKNRVFDPVMVSFILAATVAIGFEDVHVETSYVKDIIFVADIVFLVIITVEFFIRLVSSTDGFSNGWRRLDLVIILLNTVALLDKEAQMFRALRLLMMVSRVGKLSEVATRISKVFRNLLGTLTACGCFWLVFALWGVFWLHGTFYKCVEPEEGNRPDYRIISGKHECLYNNMSWENSAENFDHVGNAFLSLIFVSSFKGWIGIMYDAADSRDVHDEAQPRRNASFNMYIYFMVFIIFGVFLCLSYVIAEAVARLNKLGENQDEKTLPILMSESELNLEAAGAMRTRMKLKMKKVLPAPQGRMDTVLQTCLTSGFYETGMVVFMIFYFAVGATDHYSVSEEWYPLYISVHFTFIAVIGLECILKVATLRRHYFSDSSNLFDFLVFVIALADVVVMGIRPAIIFCVLRATKSIVLYISGRRPATETLLITMRESLAEVLLSAKILLIVICTYSIFGMLAFKHVKLRAALDDMWNFQTFGSSFLVMFQVTTGAGWDGILQGIRDETDCDLPDDFANHPGDCGRANLSVIFMVSFLLLCFVIIAHMFLVVIQHYFLQARRLHNGLTEKNLKDFDQVWTSFSSHGQGQGQAQITPKIRLDQLSDFLDALQPPLQIPKPNDDQIEAMNIPLRQDDELDGDDVFQALVKSYFLQKISNQNENSV